LAFRLTPSVERHRGFFRERAESQGIHVLSGGFRELIEPAATALGIPSSRIHAHRFRYTAEGAVVGLDPETPLARGGKPFALREMGLDPAETWMVGDGATDLEVRELGLVSTFVAFTENRARPSVTSRADQVVHSMEELLAFLSNHD
jgi:D-3-phosphoglycerate dehydrogenase / 2-oxoglutarate reductase